ncbi:MAG: aminopeptidase P family protein [Chlamydiales bacterium]|nr:aminopeptidase P family protein [Chlamydiia bacterium]MCP5507998.1 aminopeptidase P family protein [Chlamydiales bacterium]
MPYKTRIKNLQKTLGEKGCDALLIENLVDILYLTGCDLSLGKVLVTPRTARLIVDSRYYDSCKKHSPIPTRLLDKETLEKELASLKVDILGFDADHTPYQQYKNLRKLPVALKALNHPLAALRMVKDSKEIQALRDAAALGSEGFDYIAKLLKPGITEMEIAVELEIFWKRKGSKALAFDPIIAFGANSAIPHYHPGPVKLKKGMPVLIDIGVNYKHYHSDMTRVLFCGKPDKKMVEIYGIVLKAQELALAQCSPGMRIADLDKTARAYIESQGYGKQFSHSLGHGVGLEIHEAPGIRSACKKSEKLEKGMVITIEPGIYIPGTGGVRIEDTVVITKNGCENLTNRSKELTVI